MIAAIALNTFREAVRDRVLYLIVAFAVVMIFASVLLTLLTVGSEDKIIVDFGLSMIALFGALSALLIGIGLVYKEIDRRTLYTILARPIGRGPFLVGKYLGLCLTLAVNLSVMSAAFFALLLLRGVPAGRLAAAVLLTYMELLLVTAIAVLFSSFSSPILSALFSGTLYVVGHLTWSLKLLEDLLESALARATVRFLYLALPNLEVFNLRGTLAHGDPVPWERVGFAAAYGGFYAALVLLLAIAIFERRDFV